ncbi:aldo/keto reductase [Actinoallomurus soli]|uniref:aldo/keto reductase n=1 Tax=Actinoallomurus soli TaxID=2952535 RepID=UPI002093E8AB|nr:aldo/keto reductase [Actinoallomurus soli]MCO5974650.1 aldo/keto reductase [Actinoallomurus soli]
MGIDVYPLALGGSTFGWTSDEITSRRVLDGFLDAGGNLIDTSDSYSAFVPGNSGGESETIIGAWMAARRNRGRVVIGTKVSQHPEFAGLSAANVEAAADASLKRLGTDYIDLYWAHYDDPDVPLQETAEAFDALVRAGKVRAIGVSNYSGERIREWITIAHREGYAVPVAVQPLYNLVKRDPYERDIAPVVAAENLAVLPYQALAGGFLTGKYRAEPDVAGGIRQYMAHGFYSEAGLTVVGVLEDIAREHGTTPAAVALAWLCGRPGVVAPIASARTVGQLTSMTAFTRFELAAGQRSALDDVSARVPST